jgi:hypothetical protein
VVLAAFVCIVWCCLPAPPARADAPPRILLLRPPSTEAQLSRRLQAEFTNLGITVVEVADESDDDPTRFLVESAARERAFAAIRVVSNAGGVTVWVADRLTNKILVRTLAPSSSAVGSEVVALEVVELLRASLLELSVSPKTRPAPPADVGGLLDARREERAPPPVQPPSSRVHAEIAPTALLTPGGVGPSGHAELGFRYGWTPRVSSRAFVLLPVVPGEVNGAEGSAEVSVGLAGLGLDFAVTEPSSPWTLLVGPAVAAAQIRTVGKSASELLEGTSTVYAAVPLLATRFERRVFGRVAIGGQMFAGMSVPRPVILFGNREAAHWGRPLIGAALILDFLLD